MSYRRREGVLEVILDELLSVRGLAGNSMLEQTFLEIERPYVSID